MCTRTCVCNKTDYFTGITLKPQSTDIFAGGSAEFKCLLPCPFDIDWTLNDTYVNSQEITIFGLHLNVDASLIPNCSSHQQIIATLNVTVLNDIVTDVNVQILCLGLYKNNNGYYTEPSNNAFLIIKGTLDSNFD